MHVFANIMDNGDPIAMPFSSRYMSSLNYFDILAFFYLFQDWCNYFL